MNSAITTPVGFHILFNSYLVIAYNLVSPLYYIMKTSVIRSKYYLFSIWKTLHKVHKYSAACTSETIYRLVIITNYTHIFLCISHHIYNICLKKPCVLKLINAHIVKHTLPVLKLPLVPAKTLMAVYNHIIKVQLFVRQLVLFILFVYKLEICLIS